MLIQRPLKTLPGLLLSTLLMTSMAAPVLAERAATGDDGRQILLQDNGTWEYKNNDRFATSEDGTRVRLKDNGSWEFIGHAPVVTEDNYRGEALDIMLNNVTTESRKVSSPSGKSSRVSAETVFNLDVNLSSYSKQSITPKLSNLNLFKMTDDHGTRYDIVGVTPANQTLKPGESYRYQVRGSGAPQYTLAWRVKTITLQIDKTVFATGDDIVLTLDADNIIETKL